MDKKIFGLYLAAGQSSRMGQNKLALLWRGKPLGSFGLQAAIDSKLDRILMVLNPDNINKWAEPLIRHPKVVPLFCPFASEGQGASIRFGIAEAMERNIDGVVIQLADQPFVSCEILNNLVESFYLKKQKSPLNYAGYVHNGLMQPPILFPKSMFPLLKELKGDTGARHILKGRRVKGLKIKAADYRTFMDVDTPEDLQSLSGRE